MRPWILYLSDDSERGAIRATKILGYGEVVRRSLHDITTIS